LPFSHIFNTTFISFGRDKCAENVKELRRSSRDVACITARKGLRMTVTKKGVLDAEMLREVREDAPRKLFEENLL
jgi:hypothetical protein